AQSLATQGRSLSTPAPLRALRARTPDPAWSQPAVGEGVRSCPRAGCGKSACPVRCQAVRGRRLGLSALPATGHDRDRPHYPVVRRKPIQVSQDGYYAVQLEKLGPLDGNNRELAAHARSYTRKFIEYHRDEKRYAMAKHSERLA